MYHMTGVVLQVQEEAQNIQLDHRPLDKVQLPSNDITIMHEAIPFLPVPVALFCLFLNIIIPGSGYSVTFSGVLSKVARSHFRGFIFKKTFI